MPPVKAVLFDYGQVLSTPPDPAAWARMLTITGLAKDTLHHSYWLHRHHYDRGDLNGLSYWQNVADTAGLILTPAQIESLIAADIDLWSRINQPMLEWAQSLQRAGIPTGILSNIGDAMSRGLLARHSWLNGFSAHTWSCALNLAKPEPAIYTAAAKSLQTPPENILFIDDKVENIAAAESIGMQAIQYPDHATFEHEMANRGLTWLLNLTSAASNPPIPKMG
jgi:putative hydrolase of the HAD superfamily